MMRTLCHAGFGCLLMFCAVPFTAADVLVLVDGNRITTSGPFETRGRQVRFTDASGRLMMVRASEVDFTATEAANRPVVAVAPEPAPAPEKAIKKPVLVLTDDDIREGTAGPAAATSRVPELITVYVTDWCGVCHRATAFLTEIGAPFETIDVEKVPGAQADKESIEPGCGIPVVSFGYESLCGYSESVLRDWTKQIAEAAAAAKEEEDEEFDGEESSDDDLAFEEDEEEA